MNFEYNAEEKCETEEKNVVINLLVFQDTNGAKTIEIPANKPENPSENASPYQLIYLPRMRKWRHPVPKNRNSNPKNLQISVENVKKPALKSRKSQKRLLKPLEHKPKVLYRHKKKLNVGWLHCPKEGKKFTQVRAINGGGLRYMELSKDDKPDLQEFLKLSKKLFFADKTITPYGPMNEMDFYIGNFDGQKIAHFTNNNGAQCDIWEYMQSLGLSPSRINFYLLSRSKDDSTPPLDDPTLKPENETQKQHENEFYVLVPNTLRVKFKLDDGAILDSKLCCLNDARARGLVGDDVDMENFHPSCFGYEIMSIELGEKVFFKVDYEEDCKKLSFLSCQTDLFEPHSIIHQPDDLLGLDDDGALATALVASCDDDCCPVVTWFCDGEVYAEGEKLYFVTLAKSASYQCRIKCKQMECEIMSNVITVYK